MKALSLKQPYAQLIIEGKKTIELRKWATKHRGWFLVHASKAKISWDGYDLCKEHGINIDELKYGAIIGKAFLIDVKDYGHDNIGNNKEWEKDLDKHLAGIDFITSTKGFLLKDAIKFKKPIPYKGKLNFFNVPDEVLNCN